MTSRFYQNLLGSVFLLLGGWCILFPQMVETLSLRPEYQELSKTSALLLGCFGAQAVLSSVLIFSAEFRVKTFWIFGLVGSVPFFGFNVYFYFVEEMFTDWMLLDFVGNTAILMCAIMGAKG